jgi:SOS response regulatory protein OraA/RecX
MVEPREAAMRRAGAALARRARSEAELARALAPVAPPEVVAGVLADLRSRGYVDDTALACALAERRLSSGWGAHRVRADLERLEIEGDGARAGIALAEGGERTAAENLVALRASGADARRVTALLMRRGFSEETIEALVVPDLHGEFED